MMKLAENLKLAHHTAWKIHSRIVSSGVSVEYDDVFQDVAVVWLACEQKFDESKGYAFSTYFVSAANFTVFKDHQKKSSRFNSDLAHTDEFDFTVPDGSGSAEVSLIGDEWVKMCLSKLSPLARTVLGLTINPPALIINSLQAMQDKAKYARDCGVHRRAPTELNLSTVCQILNLTRWTSEKITREIKEVFCE